MKICGVTRPDDARVAERAGASHVGAVLVPASTRAVTPERAAALYDAIGLPLVIVVADLSAAEAAASATEARARVIQLHGGEPPERLRELRERGPWELWKAARVRGADDIERAVERFGAEVDLLLLDGWHPDGLGGMGRRFPWEALAAARDALREQVPIGVGGGLTPENVAEAVASLHPAVVDVSSGVEVAPGVKDPDRIRAFVRNATHAQAEARS